MMDQCRQFIDRVQESGIGFCMASQYCLLAEACASRVEGRIEEIAAVLKTPGRNSDAGAARVWIDLGPHLIGALQHLLPGLQVNWGSLELQTVVQDATFVFSATSDAGDVQCSLTTGQRTQHVRTLTLNGLEFDMRNGNDEEVRFCTDLHGPSGNARAGRHALVARPFSQRGCYHDEWRMSSSSVSNRGRSSVLALVDVVLHAALLVFLLSGRPYAPAAGTYNRSCGSWSSNSSLRALPPPSAHARTQRRAASQPMVCMTCRTRIPSPALPEPQPEFPPLLQLRGEQAHGCLSMVQVGRSYILRSKYS